MVYTKLLLEMMVARQIPTFNEYSQLAPTFIKAGKCHIGNSWKNFLAPPTYQSYLKRLQINYLLCITDKQNVHLRTGCTELSRTWPCAILLPPTPNACCNTPSMIVVHNLQACRIVSQRSKTPVFMKRAIMIYILLNRIRGQKANSQTPKIRNTRTRSKQSSRRR